jgi:alkyl hydroperoxide reductase subunit F
VPSIFANEKFIHSGKISLNSAIELLEEQFGTKSKPQASDLGHFDLITIGGGPAGVSAAIYAARKGLKTAIIAEKIGGQVLDTKGIENLISVPYIEGPDLAEKLHSHLRQYPITILSDRRVENLSEDTRQIQLNSGEKLTGTSIIIATGAKWRQLNVPGEKEYLGRGVAYCPHCDGPFFTDKKVAVVGGGNSGVEAAIDLSNICREVVLFEFMGQLKADQVLIDKLKSTPNIKVLTNVKVTEVVGNREKVSKLQYQNNQSGDSLFEDVDGVFVQIGLLPNSAVVKGIVELNAAGEILVDVKGRTNKKGIYAAGDVTNSPYKQIITSLGDGAKVALSVFEDQMRAGT